jgi:hypothetical protein
MMKSEVVALQMQIRELQRVLGEKTLESEILREAMRIAHEKFMFRCCHRCSRRIHCDARCSGPGRILIEAYPAGPVRNSVF